MIPKTGTHFSGSCSRGKNERIMRAETEKLVEDIKRSIGLLRRHL
jgi:hypothetical protein